MSDLLRARGPRRGVALFFVIVLAGGLAGAAGASEGETVDKALAANDKTGAVFELFRSLSSRGFVPTSEDEAILKKMRLEPKGFIPASWPEPVRRWFVERGRTLWPSDPERIHSVERRIEVAHAASGERFATLALVPEVQAWYEIENGLSTQRQWIFAGASKPYPLLAFGRTVSGQKKSQPATILPLYSLRAVHHASLFFQDVDGDRQDELVVKVTWIVSNGFTQSIFVYRVQPGLRLDLWKTYRSDTGVFLRWAGASEPQPIRAVDVQGEVPADLD